MLASDVVEKLQGYIKLYGDLPVELCAYDTISEDYIECDVTGVAHGEEIDETGKKFASCIIINGSR